VRTRVWIPAALFTTFLAIGTGSSLGQGQALAPISKLWWALPLSASVLSFAIIATVAFARNLIPSVRGDALSTGAYLASGPSLAVLGVLSWISPLASPPDWVGSFMLLLLFISAGLYYRDSRDADEEGAGLRSAGQRWPNLP